MSKKYIDNRAAINGNVQYLKLCGENNVKQGRKDTHASKSDGILNTQSRRGAQWWST